MALERLTEKLRVTDIGVSSKGKLLTLRHGQELRVQLRSKNWVSGYLMNIHADGWRVEYLALQTGAGMRMLIFGKEIEAIQVEAN